MLCFFCQDCVCPNSEPQPFSSPAFSNQRSSFQPRCYRDNPPCTNHLILENRLLIRSHEYVPHVFLCTVFAGFWRRKREVISFQPRRSSRHLATLFSLPLNVDNWSFTPQNRVFRRVCFYKCHHSFDEITSLCSINT